MAKYLLLRKLRSVKVLIKNNTGSTFAMLAIICFSISYIFNFVLFNAMLIQTYTKELLTSICVIQAFIILFQKRLVIRIHPASIHYFYNTDVFVTV